MTRTSIDRLSNAVANRTVEQTEETSLDQLLNSQRERVARALPAGTGMTPDRLLAVAYTLVRTNPKLGTCTGVSLLGALTTTAQLGLEPGPLAHVYFIPRWNSKGGKNERGANEVNFQVGYKGMVELARRNGVQIKTRVVYENDKFDFAYGIDDSIVHKPTLGDRGAVLGYYLIATWHDTDNRPASYIHWANLDDINRIRDRSDSFKKGYGPWVTDYDAMAKKTLVRAAFASNSIPTSTVIAQALNVDESVRRVIDAEAIDEIPEEHRDNVEPPASSPPPALGSGPADDDDGEQADIETGGGQEPGEPPAEDGVDSSSAGGDDGSAVVDELDGVPDDAEAIGLFLRGRTKTQLRDIARTYSAVVPRSKDDSDAIDELAQRIIDARLNAGE